MEAKSTQEFIAHIAHKDYTDLIFDFDETICHLKIDWSSWFDDINEITQDLGETPIEKWSSPHAHIEHLIKNHGERARSRINAVSLACERNHLNSVVDNEQLVHFIKEDTTHTMHILSNNMTETIIKQLERLDIREKFSEIIGRDNSDISKPNPASIDRIVKLSGQNKDQFLMIGDNLHSDIAAAERAGIDGFLITMHE